MTLVQSPPIDRPARVFVGIKVAEQLAQELTALAQPLGPYRVRLVPSVDIHLTLVPPWNELNTAGTVEVLQATIRGFKSFPLTLTHLGYGPTRREPRLLWAECAAGPELNDLRRALLTAFGQSDPRPFLPHITLARMLRNGRSIARHNPIDRSLSLTQLVTSVELFQSPPPGQRGYRVLASLPLGQKPDEISAQQAESGTGADVDGFTPAEHPPS